MVASLLFMLNCAQSFTTIITKQWKATSNVEPVYFNTILEVSNASTPLARVHVSYSLNAFLLFNAVVFINPSKCHRGKAVQQSVHTSSVITKNSWMKGDIIKILHYHTYLLPLSRQVQGQLIPKMAH